MQLPVLPKGKTINQKFSREKKHARALLMAAANAAEPSQQIAEGFPEEFLTVGFFCANAETGSLISLTPTSEPDGTPSNPQARHETHAPQTPIASLQHGAWGSMLWPPQRMRMEASGSGFRGRVSVGGSEKDDHQGFVRI